MGGWGRWAGGPLGNYSLGKPAVLENLMKATQSVLVSLATDALHGHSAVVLGPLSTVTFQDAS